MKRLVMTVSAAAIAISAPVRGADGSSQQLTPSSPWNLDYSEQACRAGRTFGSGEDKVFLLMSKYAPGPSFEVMLLGKSLSPKGSKFKFGFYPAEDPQTVDPVLYGTGKDGSTTWQFSGGLLAKEDREAFDERGSTLRSIRDKEQAIGRELEGVEIASGVATPVVLRTGPLDRILAAMDTCLDDLVTYWGFDPAVQNTLARVRPKSSPARWVTSADYPTKALQKRLSGAVRIRLMSTRPESQQIAWPRTHFPIPSSRRRPVRPSSGAPGLRLRLRPTEPQFLPTGPRT